MLKDFTKIFLGGWKGDEVPLPAGGLAEWLILVGFWQDWHAPSFIEEMEHFLNERWCYEKVIRLEDVDADWSNIISNKH